MHTFPLKPKFGDEFFSLCLFVINYLAETNKSFISVL